MTGYPIQPAKVQRPQLRDETLARDRLLDWVAAKIHHRVILILADAGYGKTTLLADFSRRTRVRTLWYRLDDDDRDWMSFLSHLVAAGREDDPGFAPRTAALLSDLAMGGPTREAATNVFLSELPSIAERGAILILDDFHLVDESPDVRQITRELVARAPERLSIVFASRHAPTIPLARLRTTGEVAEIGTDDLRFDAAETARLFTETYGRDLEPDVIADVAARTEGWAASLQLVQAALRDRSPGEIRRFVRGLTGADQELYDYLAEEVVGDLPEDLQRFLMRTSILQSVTADLAGVVTELDEVDVGRLTAAAERLTLLSRPPRSSKGPRRYHPLVREFLEARLRSSIGSAAMAQLHRQVADAASDLDWRIAAYHYREAGDPAAVAAVLVSAIPDIMSSASYAVASEFIDATPTELRPAGFGIVEARLRMQLGDYEGAVAASGAVLSESPIGSERDHALLNLLTFHMNTGDVRQAASLAGRLSEATSDADLKLIAEAARLSIEAGGTAGNLDSLGAHLEGMATRQRGRQNHYYGVTMLNLALISIHQDRPRQALIQLEDATQAFEPGSAWIETAATLVLKGATLAQLGMVEEASALSSITLRRPELRAEPDLLLETAEYEDSYGDPSRAPSLLDEADSSGRLTAKHRSIRALIGARYMIRRRRFDEAKILLDSCSPAGGTSPAFGAARLVVMAHFAVATGSPDADSEVEHARNAARNLRAHRWRRASELLRAYVQGPDDLSAAVESIGSAHPWHLTFFADLLVQRTDELTRPASEAMESAMNAQPRRWRQDLRAQLERSTGQSRIRIGRLLEIVGDESDIRRLREAGRELRRTAGASDLGRALARRLAPKVRIEDLGRISVRVGGRLTPGTNLRRRVLALLAFLLTRPEFSSTRDQVLDALWPDLGPDLAMNSLNQTVYFMRRVFEEDFNDDLSPGYLHHDSEVIWLDRDLVSSASSECAQTIRAMGDDPSPHQVERLSTQYTGRFALDFEYEEWTQAFRDWLHASYLQIVERAVATDLATGHFDRGIRVARRALEVDPSAESVEVSLLRLYRVSGAHSAAAEQYGHYASRLKEELDVDAPPLETI